MILVTIIKALVRRRRPLSNKSDMFMTYGADVYSFPSGHISRAVLISIFFSKLYPTNGLVQVILFAWAIAVASSRVLLKRHYILDVVGGAVLGFLTAGILSVLWMSQSTSLWIVSSLSEENVNLEGLQDSD